MKKQQSGSEYRMLHSFSRDELYELLKEKGQVGIHLGGRWYGILKTLKREQIVSPDTFRHTIATSRIFLFSDHKGYDEEWRGIIKQEAFQGYRYAFMLFYDRPQSRWRFPDAKIFVQGITLYDI